MISVSCIPFYIHVQLAVMLSFHVVQHAQIEKCIPRRFCIKQNNQKKIFLKVPKRDKQSVIQTFERVLAKVCGGAQNFASSAHGCGNTV